MDREETPLDLNEGIQLKSIQERKESKRLNRKKAGDNVEEGSNAL